MAKSARKRSPTDGYAPMPTPPLRCRYHSAHVDQRDVTPKRSLNTLQLLGVMFVACVGGPYGIEGCVRTGGGLWTLMAIAVLPWLWGLPSALVIAELSTSIPANSGADAWISCAFPPWFALATVLWGFFISRLDNALYPNLFVDYLAQSHPLGGGARVALKALFVAVCTLPNVYGIELVGASAVILMVLTMLPFAALAAAEPLQPGHDVLLATAAPADGVRWSLFLPYVVWNLSGYDAVGHITEEVLCASTTLIRALVALLVASQVCYGLPVLAGLSIHHRAVDHDTPANFSGWADGHLVALARVGHGEWLAGAMSVGAVASAFGLMVSLLCTTSRALQGHAMLGVFPAPVNAVLGRIHPVYKTPVNAVLANAALCFVISAAAEFDALLSVATVLYALRLLAVMAAALLIRRRYPTLPRPFQVPVSDAVLAALLVIPFGFCAACAVLTLSESPEVLYVSCTIVAASGPAAMLLARRSFPKGLDSKIVTVDAHGEDPP
eukprot:TRINITY_DN16852_c0_g1_i1.p1 TRINITY_DN16852_c0_g1~~TRINITY_DN16852_c0_g1_i1.p1  ORF type:complete len:539 (+),score=87.37 TRINITY_DN16852_c0_g1_i1:128-1618(+)